jgi:AcrR family transcriptional regulator
MSEQSATRDEPKVLRRKGQQRRRQILDTAKAQLIRKGTKSLVLRDLAEQLGITHGNLQYYFPTRHALFVAIFDEEVAKYTDGIHAAVRSTTSRQGRLAAIVDSAVEELKHPETALWRLLASMADHNAEMAAILQHANEQYQKVLVAELKEVAPHLSLARRRHIARIIHAIIDGLGIQFSYEDPNSPDMRGLGSEIKAALLALIDVE